jgi:hypothetical protein
LSSPTLFWGTTRLVRSRDQSEPVGQMDHFRSNSNNRQFFHERERAGIRPRVDGGNLRASPTREADRRTAWNRSAGSRWPGTMALASDLPASPFGPYAGGLWPFAASGPAPSWEGPATPLWVAPANSGPGVTSPHLLVLAAALVGVVLLAITWLGLWRAVRADRGLGFHNLWWVVAVWTTPLLFAAPFASQDVWVYAAGQGGGLRVELGEPAPSPRPFGLALGRGSEVSHRPVDLRARCRRSLCIVRDGLGRPSLDGR